ncbi:FAD-dependent oxidoreductase [Aureivirga marina]|uniref:FAD-dependent oxidoreductase n=1 Tax=Aureivirga marina TaxID=1182451 RepID=UPI0018C91C34|nr:NAD(P)/FAD-dependent oxidoreductase [Aureivirga marina]
MQIAKNIAIVGSGLVGTLLGIYLKKRGHDVTIFDRRPDIRDVEFSGRSINMAMSDRGWNALEKIGIAEEIREIGIPMRQRAIHLNEKPVFFQPYGKEGEAIYSISRGVLNRKVIDLAEAKGIKFLFNEKVWDVDLPNAIIYTGKSEIENLEAHKFDLIFGADGAFSRTRHKMQRRSRFDYSQEFINHGYKELTIPATEDNKHLIDKNSLHIWPRGEFMLIALPNLDGTFTCTLFLPFEGETSFDSLTDEIKVTNFFMKYFPDALLLMPNLPQEFFKNPMSALVTIKCFPWVYWDKVALIGDAAHAIVPFYGQGMNAGFEDITILDEMMEKYGDDWGMIFQEYQKERKPNADAIAELSLQNFIEMRDKTADEKFQLRKKIEKKFSEKYPELWVPLYSRVTFSLKPYKEALDEGKKQRNIMDEIMKIPHIEQIWDSQKIEDKLLELLQQTVEN